MNKSRGKAVAELARSKIQRILQDENEHRIKAELAELRKGIGVSPGDRPELWWLIFENFPEEYMSDSGIASREEWSYYLAITMFALHQQGHNIRSDSMHKEGVSFGTAVRRLAKSGEEDEIRRIRRRFNIVATSADINELAHHLRGIIQLLRAEDISLDYGKLAEDLYYYQIAEKAPEVRLRWGQDFCRTNNSKEWREKE